MKNKKMLLLLVVGICLFLIPTQLFAKVSGNSVKTYKCPFLLTSAGQGPGSKSLRLLINMSKGFSYGTDFYLEDEPEPRLKEIQDGNYSAIFMVMGSTDKGLGASGITIEDEIKNLKKVISLAKSKNIPIIAVHIEQDKRAPKIPTNANERIIDLVCPESEWMICVEGSNKDGRFTALSEKYDIPLTTVGSALEFIQLCKTIFIK